MLISQKQQIEDSVIKNLLSAHERIAGSGKVFDLVCLSKYLFRLAEKREDILIDLLPESNQERCGEPV